MIKTIPSDKPGEVLRLDGHPWTYDDAPARPVLLDGFTGALSDLF